MQKKLTFNEAKQIAIVEYLDKLGISPAKIRGNDHWYYSPFRDEGSPSFKVDTRLNLWYDYGSGEGGSIVDLGAKLHDCSLSEFLDRLAEGISSFTGAKFQTPVEKESNKLEIHGTRELTDPGLLQYLKERSIERQTAVKFCVEVDFRIGTKSYNAIGFPTRSGSYELRNRWFKGSSSPKDISIIQGGPQTVCVLEGFIDFLSLQQTHDYELNRFKDQSSFIVLNSLSLLNRTLATIQTYKQVNLFLDNDNAGLEAKKNLAAKGIVFNDASRIYRDSKDVNEFLIKSQHQHHQFRNRKGFGI
ncbi:MAG TPA: toprim domain-containing protein [Cyclobacteriaceae bacterium]|nr:toprim domain-containing protein [Cyclobacteriaceae bacterium]